MTSQCTQSDDHTPDPRFTFKWTAIVVVVLASLLLTAPGVLAQTNVDFLCGLGSGSVCTGTVVQSGSNFSTTGISVFNDSGPYSFAVPFTFAFDTATGLISISGTGIYTGENLIGSILSSFSSSGGSTTGVFLVANWPTLPASVQTQLGSMTGMDSAFAIYLTTSGVAQSVDVLITPTPEPASMLLVGTGLLAIGGFLRKRRNA